MGGAYKRLKPNTNFSWSLQPLIGRPQLFGDRLQQLTTVEETKLTTVRTSTRTNQHESAAQKTLKMKSERNNRIMHYSIIRRIIREVMFG